MEQTQLAGTGPHAEASRWAPPPPALPHAVEINRSHVGDGRRKTGELDQTRPSSGSAALLPSPPLPAEARGCPAGFTG